MKGTYKMEEKKVTKEVKKAPTKRKAVDAKKWADRKLNALNQNSGSQNERTMVRVISQSKGGKK